MYTAFDHQQAKRNNKVVYRIIFSFSVGES